MRSRNSLDGQWNFLTKVNGDSALISVPSAWQADARCRGDEPLLVSKLGNNGTAPWWFDTVLEWADAVVYPRDVAQRFKAYHLDKIFPSLTAFAEASQHLQYDALKHEIEQIRCYESIQGYVITEFTHVH